MKNKYLIFISIASWCNIGVFYYLYLNRIETILIGVFRELTIIPSYLCAIIFPVWVLIKVLIKRTNN